MRPRSDHAASLGLQNDDVPIVRACHISVGPAAQHVRAHVGENDSPAVEPLTILTEGLVVEVQATYRAVWRGVGSGEGDPVRQGDAGDALVEAQFANELQWIIWLDERRAVEWAGGAMEFDWAGLMEVAVRASEERREETNGAPRSIVRGAERAAREGR